MNSINANKDYVRIEGLSTHFKLKHPAMDVILRKPRNILKAVDGVSFSIDKGETLGLVGESGCGKSTLARTIMRLYEPHQGKVYIDGIDIVGLRGQALQAERKKFQMIFQDPYSSLNPRKSVRDMLAEVMLFHRVCARNEIDERISTLLETVGMSSGIAQRFPGEFSGGQRQRLGIARALALNPSFVIADEPVSALDVSIQAQIINLLSDIQKSLNLTLLFISHDLRVVRHVTHRVAVMYLGKIVEMADTEELFHEAAHPYTKVLLKAAPILDPRNRTREYAIEGEPPSAIKVPKGCRFNPRCPIAKDICRSMEPELKEIIPGRKVACHFPLIA